jgi:o-succinylbenzoate---CoA ligase
MSRLVPDWLRLAALSHPERPALLAASGRWNSGQLDDAADALAAALVEGGIGEGSRVVALLADDAPMVILIAAVRRLGAVLVPLNRRAARAELEHQVGVARAAAVVHDEAHATRARELVGAASLPRLAVEELLAPSPRERPAASRVEAIRAEVDLDAPATIVFTSGTTGRPRAAVLSHGNHTASADAWASVLSPRPRDRWLACLPLCHVAGLAIVMRAGRWGVPLEVVERFDAGHIAARIEAGITHLSLVPTQLEPLLEVLDRVAATATLRAVLVGGGPIPIGTLERARATGLPVLTTYGSTETGSGVAVGGAEAATLRDPAALRALPGVELRIAEPTDDAGIGPVLVRGAMVFRGYLDDPTATADRLRGGWLHTGDLGSLDGAGLLRIADRRDDLIVSGGENIYPAEVEAVLLAHPDILDAAVLGQPDPVWGSVPVAAIVVAPGSAVGDAALLQHCRDHLAGYKVPVRLARLAELPRNASGKILRHQLRDALTPEGR